MVWLILAFVLIVAFLTMGADRLSHRLGYGSRGTWLAIAVVIGSGAAILFLSLPYFG